MARVRIILAAALAVAALGVLAGSASASVSSASNPKFCKALTNYSSSSGSSQPSKNDAKQAIKPYKNALKYAPAKVKSAMKKVISYYGILAKADKGDLSDLYTGSKYLGYAKAIGTFTTYFVSTCIGAS